jgi:hypothetical protein
MKIYGFYHIACLNHWKDVFIEQINKIKLMKNVDNIFISIIVNNDDDIIYIKNNIYDICKIVSISYNFNDYEFSILKYLHELSKNEEFYCFYLHTKGVSINKINMRNYYGSENLEYLLECVNGWRKYMEYFLVDRSVDAINKLTEYDAVGVALVLNPEKHFSGNFWWSKSEYIKKLKSFNEVDINKRHNAEFWIGNNNDGNLVSLCDLYGSYVKIINNNEYIN